MSGCAPPLAGTRDRRHQLTQRSLGSDRDLRGPALPEADFFLPRCKKGVKKANYPSEKGNKGWAGAKAGWLPHLRMAAGWVWIYTRPPPVPFPALRPGQGLRERRCRPSRPLGDRRGSGPGPTGRGAAGDLKEGELGGADGEGATSGCPLRHDVIRSIFSGGVTDPDQFPL